MSLFDLSKKYANITAFYALSLTKFDMILHSHESCEIMYVKKGHCMVQTNSEQRTLYEGDFVFLDAYTSHQLTIENRLPCSLLNLEFEVSTRQGISLEELRKHCPPLRQKKEKTPRIFFAHDNEKIRLPLEKLIDSLSQSPLQKKTAEETFLISLLFQQCLLELGNSLQKHPQHEQSPHLKKALLYINEHLDDELRVPMIAQHVGINKSYLHSLFSDQLGDTISNYINRKRLEQACFLLANSELSITDVAFQVGYNSRQHFSQTFSRHYQISPQDYKLQKQNIEYRPDNIGQFRKEANEWEIIKMKD